MAEEQEIAHDDEIVTCWCGATGPASQMFDDSIYDRGCGGSGTLHCECGGEFCVCHNHGEVECPGCEDCSCDDDDWDDDCDYFDGEE